MQWRGLRERLLSQRKVICTAGFFIAIVTGIMGDPKKKGGGGGPEHAFGLGSDQGVNGEV